MMVAKASIPVAAPVQLYVEDRADNLVPVRAKGAPYELVAASQTAQVLGATGGPGDLLNAIVVSDNTGTITVLDGAVPVFVIPAGFEGVYDIDAVAITNWNITTAAATSCMCIGHFTA